jgi:hypothetical protein
LRKAWLGFSSLVLYIGTLFNYIYLFNLIKRIAQDYFLQSGTSLALNVKSSIMDKLCRFLQADPMISIDDLVKKSYFSQLNKYFLFLIFQFLRQENPSWAFVPNFT